MRRICAVLALTALACLVATTPAGAAARSKCQRLKGNDLAPARTVKLVKRPNGDDGTDLVGCVLPRGRVHEVASSADMFTTTYGYRLRQVAGRIVLVTSTYASQYANTQSTRVTDLRSGLTYTVAYTCAEIGGGICGPQTAAVAVFVTKLGRAVAAIGGPGGIAIATFDPRGARRELDRGPDAELPPGSLRLAGTIASWTHGGEPRSADISRPG